MIAESIGLAQVEKPMASTGVEDSALQTSTTELSTVKSCPYGYRLTGYHSNNFGGAGHDLCVDEPAVGLASAPGEMALASTDIVRTIIERGFGSPSTELAPAMNMIEELAHHMV